MGVFNNHVFSSPSGNILSWNEITFFPGYNIVAVTFGNIWVIKAYSQDPSDNQVYFSTSDNTKEWLALVPSTFTSNNDSTLSFCATSNVYISLFDEGTGTSTDGVTWTLVDTSFTDVMHSIVCIDDNCIGASQGLVYSSSTCGNNWGGVGLEDLDYIPIPFPVVGNLASPTFFVGGNDALIFTQAGTGPWYQTLNADSSQTKYFRDCTDLIYSNATFISTCYQSILISSNGVNWGSISYTLEGTSDKQITLITPEEKGTLLGVIENNFLYESLDNGYSFSPLVQITLREGEDDFNIYNIRALNGRWIAMGSDLWPISSSSQFTPYYEHNEESLNVYNPFFAISQNYNSNQWNVYGSNAWINDITFLNNLYYGAGKGGVFSSSDFYNWKTLSTVNGECTAIATDSLSNIIATCGNNNGVSVDNILIISEDSGVSWSNYKSPCATSNTLSESQIQCTYLQYLNYTKNFVTYSNQETGSIFLSDTLKVTGWSLVSMPYAVGVVSVFDNGIEFVALTDEVILSMNHSSLAYEYNIVVLPYTTAIVAPERATFPAVGYITSFPEEYHEDDLNNGGVWAVVISSVIGIAFILGFFVVIGFGLFITYKLNRKRKDNMDNSEASTLL